MVDIRVRVGDTTRVPELMRRLSKIFGESSVSFNDGTSEVWIASEWESRRVVNVIEAVQDWVAEDDETSATLSIGDRSYTTGAIPPPVSIR